MKKTNRSVLKALSLLCVLLLFLTGSCAIPVFGDEGVVFNDRGGKHNAPISVDPISEEDGFSAVLYNNTNGLPTSEANDIVQTSEGFIWIGSYGGLIRYDGGHFERIAGPVGINSVRCLYVDSQGRLWVGTNDKGVVMIENGEYYSWDMDDGLKSLSVRSIIEDGNGDIYVATTEGLVVIDENKVLSYIEDLRVIDVFLHELRMGADGRIYAVCNSGDVVVLKNRKVLQYYRFSSDVFNGVNCILPDPEDPDLVYLETLDGAVYHTDLEKGVTEGEEIDISPLYQVQSFEYFDGNVWVCTRNGVGVLNDSGMHVVKNLPMNNSIGHMMTDYEGNLWFTSTREGVMKVVNNRFVDLFERYGLSKRVVNATCMYDDRLFVATDSGLVVLDKEKVVDKVELDEPVTTVDGVETNDLLTLLDNCRLRSLYRDSKDRLWICTWRNYGLLCYDHGKLRAYREYNGTILDSFRIVYECDDGKLYAAYNGGVLLIKDDEIAGQYGGKDGIVNTDVLSVTEGKGDDVLLGTDGGGIYVISRNGIDQIDHEDGLTSDNVMRIKRDERRGIYWVVTGNSISYLDEDYKLNLLDNIPYFNNFDLYENDRGELWILASNGIYVVNTEDILSGKEVNPIYYTMNSGLPCITTANSYSELTDEGILYIAGTTGVAKADINETYESVGDLKFAVPYVEVDGRLTYPDETGVFFVPQQAKRVTIYGYVFTYSLVDPVVSYILHGFDEEYTSGNAKDLFPVNYTNLPGGEYIFEMDMNYSLSDEIIGTSILIVKDKSPYEQGWFYIYAALCAAIIFYALINVVVERTEEKLEKRHKEESERQRIVNELNMGNDIQRGVLPHIFPPFPDRKEVEIYASMDPAKEVGGDFYDYFFIDDDHLCFLMADVSGKGIPGALFMMVTKTIIHNSAMFAFSPAETLMSANETICADNQTQMFVTVWLGVLELSTGILRASNAGHEYPIIRKAGGDFEIFKDKHGFVLGGMEGMKYKDYEIKLEPGSRIFLYTDGIPEATDKNNRMFGMDNLVKALNSSKDSSPEELLKDVRTAVDRFVNGAEQFDDLTMLCMEYKGPKGS